MKANVKKDTCIGCGACTVIADNIFQIGDDGLAEIVNSISDSDKESVLDAYESCPVSAIEIENEEND